MNIEIADDWTLGLKKYFKKYFKNELGLLL